MENTDLSRRHWLATIPAAGAALALTAAAGVRADSDKEPFGYCLNTATIMGQKLKLNEQIDVAARAGYQGLEPWLRDLDQYVQGGGSLKEIAKRLRDHGLRVVSAIDFFEWIVEDDARRAKGLEAAKRSMDRVQQIGGTRIAAPPAGAPRDASLDLRKVADRYRALLELGDRMEVVPEVEVWGHSKTLSRLGEAAQVAIDSGHPRACILADVFHLYKGGSGFTGIKLLSGSAMHVLHMNDYPAEPPRTRISDQHRVYPGEGVAPLKSLLRDLHAIGFRGMLSLEMFNRTYWAQDALTVARTGLEKMQAVVRASLG
jgi:sugar phosphate isomerase/epimerase